MVGTEKREVEWMGNSKKDLAKLPREPKEYLTYGIFLAEKGKRHPNAKPFGGNAEEIVCDHDTNTYRAVYTLSLDGWVYVLHCFQKKSKKGIKTPKPDVDLIESRLKDARLIHAKRGRNKA
jgi:phage-related protein